MKPGRDRRRERARPPGGEGGSAGSPRGGPPGGQGRGDDREDREEGRFRRGGKAPPSLVQSAARRLEGGPVHTLELARDVLGLSGHAGAAAAAVYSLLGPDPRFRVDAAGTWSLDAALRGVGPSLGFLDYAVVDVETTGGDPEQGHRIIEVAIVEVREGVITRDFRTLVNPGRTIPPGVVQLTGITDADVSVAPFFEDVAEQVADRLRGRVFVAQNAAFDRKFVAAQLLEATGDVPPAEILCTVRMARRLVPELRKRNLDALSRHFGIRIHGRHRAYGDALATARIFLRLLDEAAGKGIHDLHRLVTFLGGNLGTDRSDPRPDPDDDPGGGYGP